MKRTGMQRRAFLTTLAAVVIWTGTAGPLCVGASAAPPPPPDIVARYSFLCWKAILTAARSRGVSIPSLPGESFTDAFQRIRSSMPPAVQNAISQRLNYLWRLMAGNEQKFVRAIRDPAHWRGARMGSASLPLVAAAVTAVVFGTMGYVAGNNLVKAEELRATKAEDAAFAHLVNLLVKGMQSGRVKLLPGLTLDRAIARITENMQVGRAPYLNVLEVRPYPNIAGSWEGELTRAH